MQQKTQPLFSVELEFAFIDYATGAKTHQHASLTHGLAVIQSIFIDALIRSKLRGLLEFLLHTSTKLTGESKRNVKTPSLLSSSQRFQILFLPLIVLLFLVYFTYYLLRLEEVFSFLSDQNTQVLLQY